MDISVDNIRKGQDDTRIAGITVPRRVAEGVVMNKYMKVGWVRC